MIRIGISGWRYEPWRGVWYSEGLAQRRELEFCGRHFPTVEINGSFYSLQRPQYYDDWYHETPPDFLFAVKGSRYITHLLRLRNIERPLANFFASGIFNLRDKLGPFLWQFPPQMSYDRARFDAFFSLLPRNTKDALALARRRDARMTGRARLAIDENRELRHAVEIRHPSFMHADFVALLRKHGIGLVVADTAGKWPKMFHVTSDFVYVRLHGDVKIYTSGYTDRALASWARRIRNAHPQLGPRRARCLRLLRQRCKGESAVRRADPDGQARPYVGNAGVCARHARAAPQVRLRSARHGRESRVGRPATIRNS
jgi:uncharacterized protein YecE (DUF72 family)